MNNAPLCPVCTEFPFTQPQHTIDPIDIECPRCGHYRLTREAAQALRASSLPYRGRTLLSKSLRRRYRAEGPAAPYTTEDIGPFVNAGESELPSILEQLDELILYVGTHQPSVTTPAPTSYPLLAGWLGFPILGTEQSTEGVKWLLRQGSTVKFVTFAGGSGANPDDFGPVRLTLTMDGWARYDALRRQTVDSRRAFMAMQYDEELLGIVRTHFVPAAKRAGFDLQPLIDTPKAGIIDVQLRVALRNAAFVVVDLTHGNLGAYWEAGFAEGLGRPVIYMCEKHVWQAVDKNGRRVVHFDVDHLSAIIWQKAQVQEAAEKLTQMIRNSLPDKAIMTEPADAEWPV